MENIPAETLLHHRMFWNHIYLCLLIITTKKKKINLSTFCPTHILFITDSMLSQFLNSQLFIKIQRGHSV